MNLKISKIFTLNFFIIFILMFIGFFLRTYRLNQNDITFTYDQARDAYVASQISHGDLKILGPPVSLGGFYHGVFYYYFISLPYYFSQGNPVLPIIFIVSLSILATPLVYLIGKILFNKKIGIISALLYTISFDLIQYSNWLSNPSLAVPFSVLLYFGLTLFIFTNKKNLGVVLTAIGYGLSFQSQFFLGYFLIPILFSLFFAKTKITKKHILIFTSIVIFILSSMILSYFKFGFTFIQGIQNMSTNVIKFGFHDIDFISDLKLIFIRLAENFYRNIFTYNSFYNFIFVIFCFLYTIKEINNKTKFGLPLGIMWIFLLSQSIIIPFGGDSTPYINIGLQLPAIIVSAVFLYSLIKNRNIFSITLFLFILFSSVKTIIKYNINGQTLFSIQKNLTLKNEIEVINYTYQSSQNQNFSINTITSPFWVNTLWSYLYQWYGQSKYQYTPSFHGRDQIGQLGSLSSVNLKDKYFYLIIEPQINVYPSLITDTIAYEDSFSKKIEEKNINGIIVQKRELTKPISQIEFVK